MDPVLELRAVTKRYASQTAVEGVSFAVARGSLFSLVGPSGCGKTTTLRLIAGFEAACSGEVLLNRSRISHLPPYERNVSTVFQNYALFPHLTVFENVAFGLRRRGAQQIAASVREVLELVRLTGKEHRRPAQLSGGERQRVALARSLVLHPEVLLLDEPLSALDPQLRKQVRAELKSLQRRVGITFLLITHDQEEALSLSDTIAVMNKGRIEQIGSPQEIYLRPATRFVAAFLGPMNWIDGIGIRPEATCVSLERPQQDVPVRPGVVRSAMFLGNCFHVEAELADGTAALCEAPRNGHHWKPGQTVHVWWRPSDEIRTAEE